MNKRLLTIALAACGGMVISAGAFAQQATTDQGSHSTTAAVQSSATTTTTTQTQAGGTTVTRAVPPADSNLCIRDTGSHLKPPKGQPCLPVNGNSYTQKDIQRTGHTNMGQALQELDPSVQVNGGH